MATEKRLIDVDVAEKSIRTSASLIRANIGCGYDEGAADALSTVADMLKTMPTVDAVEVDTVIEMFEYMLGDCPCNFSPVDEWLAEQCELQEECPNPEDKRGCWKQFIKHFCEKMDGDGNG